MSWFSGHVLFFPWGRLHTHRHTQQTHTHRYKHTHTYNHTHIHTHIKRAEGKSRTYPPKTGHYLLLANNVVNITADTTKSIN